MSGLDLKFQNGLYTSLIAEPVTAQQLRKAMKNNATPTGKVNNGDNKDKVELSTDGKDDGKISFKEKMKNFGKGLISPITSMFKSPKNFAIGLAAIAGSALLIAATGGTAAPVLVAAGAIGGTYQIGKNAYKASKAKTDDEAKQAWQGMGAGTTAVAASVAGAKSSLKLNKVDTSNMGAIESTLNCIKSAPKNIFASFKALKSLKFADLFASVKNIFPSFRKKPEVVDAEIVENSPFSQTSSSSVNPDAGNIIDVTFEDVPNSSGPFKSSNSVKLPNSKHSLSSAKNTDIMVPNYKKNVINLQSAPENSVKDLVPVNSNKPAVITKNNPNTVKDYNVTPKKGFIKGLYSSAKTWLGKIKNKFFSGNENKNPNNGVSIVG